eukprot:3931807-Amphidinium_carterae.1
MSHVLLAHPVLEGHEVFDCDVAIVVYPFCVVDYRIFEPFSIARAGSAVADSPTRTGRKSDKSVSNLGQHGP